MTHHRHHDAARSVRTYSTPQDVITLDQHLRMLTDIKGGKITSAGRATMLLNRPSWVVRVWRRIWGR